MPYETEQFAGTMLLAGPETAAPDVTYPLNADGWHAISIGMYCGGHLAEGSTVRVRLSGHPTFSYLTVLGDEMHTLGDEVIERYWTTADLTGQDLVLGQDIARLGSGDAPSSFRCSPVRIAYVKLVPLTAAEGRGREPRSGAARYAAAVRPQRRPRPHVQPRPYHGRSDTARSGTVPRFGFLPLVLGRRAGRPALLPLPHWPDAHRRRPNRLRPRGRPAARRELARLSRVGPGAAADRGQLRPRAWDGVPRLLPCGRLPLPTAG